MFPDLDLSTKNKIIAEKLTTMGFVEIEPLKYKKDDKEILLPSTGVFEFKHNKEVKSDVELNIMNSTLVLHAEGIVNFQPAEKSADEDGARKKLNESLIELAIKTVRLAEVVSNFNFDFSKGVNSSSFSVNYKVEISQKINDGTLWGDIILGDSNLIKDLAGKSFCKENIDCKKIVTEIIEKDIPKAEQEIYGEREDEAIELIAEQTNSEQKVFPLVYGYKHDFTRAVKKWNDAHPEQQFNLVTVKSQKYF